MIAPERVQSESALSHKGNIALNKNYDMTNVEKAAELGILNDLLENYTEERINTMTPEKFLKSWLEWEGIIGYTNRIVQIFNTFFKEEVSK